MRLTAEDMEDFGLVDRIVPEPLGGAHRDPGEAAVVLRSAIMEFLVDLGRMSVPELLAHRRAKYRRVGVYDEDDSF